MKIEPPGDMSWSPAETELFIPVPTTATDEDVFRGEKRLWYRPYRLSKEFDDQERRVIID